MNKTIEHIIHKLIYTCEKATCLIEKKASAQSLSTIERIRLKSHLVVCKWCRAYEKKVTIIDQAMMGMKKKANHKFEDAEINEFKQRLKRNIKTNK